MVAIHCYVKKADNITVSKWVTTSQENIGQVNLAICLHGNSAAV